MVSSKTLCRLGLVLIAVVLLSGCLTLESEVRLDDDGSGRLSLVYSVSEELFDYGVFDEENSRRMLPVSRRDFEVAALAAGGASLVRYSQKRRDGVVTIEATLDFEDRDALAGLMNAEATELFADGQDTTLRLPLYSGFEGPVDSAMVEEFWSDVRFIHRIVAPSTIQSVTMGEVSDNGREATVDIRLVELVEVGEPVVWEVVW